MSEVGDDDEILLYNEPKVEFSLPRWFWPAIVVLLLACVAVVGVLCLRKNKKEEDEEKSHPEHPDLVSNKRIPGTRNPSYASPMKRSGKVTPTGVREVNLPRRFQQTRDSTPTSITREPPQVDNDNISV